MVERRWTGKDGKYEVHASYVCLFQDKKVKLRKPNGSLIAVPLHLLCDADIAYITTQSKSPTRDTTHIPKLSSPSTTTTTIESPIPSPSIPQHMNSNQMIPKQSLSNIADLFKQHGFRTLPDRAVARIATFLDVHSRLRFSAVTKRCRQIVFTRTSNIWKTLFFGGCDHYRVTDPFMQQLVVFLQFKSDGLHKGVEHVTLDGTAITANTVLFLIEQLPNLKTLSLKTCWQVMSYELAVGLTELRHVITTTNTIAISKVTLGKVLHRGTTTITPSSSLDSQSFGQDVWYIHTALNKLAHRNVQLDIALCSTCQLGAADAQGFYCSCCGFLPLKKCSTCAPKCDRCGVQTCGMDTCLDPKLKVQLAKCGRCEQSVAICNNEKSSVCQKARRPCPQCHRLFHVQCRTSKGTYYKSNQCTKCGAACCPHCELVACGGGCHGQWCQQCVPSLSYCKCVIIKSSSFSKPRICNRCQTTCSHCNNSSHFCRRCLRVHLLEK